MSDSRKTRLARIKAHQKKIEKEKRALDKMARKRYLHGRDVKTVRARKGKLVLRRLSKIGPVAKAKYDNGSVRWGVRIPLPEGMNADSLRGLLIEAEKDIGKLSNDLAINTVFRFESSKKLEAGGSDFNRDRGMHRLPTMYVRGGRKSAGFENSRRLGEYLVNEGASIHEIVIQVVWSPTGKPSRRRR